MKADIDNFLARYGIVQVTFSNLDKGRLTYIGTLLDGRTIVVRCFLMSFDDFEYLELDTNEISIEEVWNATGIAEVNIYNGTSKAMESYYFG